MRTSSHFLRFLCFVFLVISSANSQVQSDGLNRDQLMNQFSMELKRSKLREDELQNEINEMKQELKDLRVRLEQEVSLSEAHIEENKCMEREEDIEKTFDGVNEELSELKKKNVALEKSVALTKHHMYSRIFNEYYKKKEPDFTWTINDIRNTVKRTNFTLLSEVFPLKGYSFGAQAKLTLDKEDYLEISLAYKDLSGSGKDLNLKLIPSAQFTYKNQPSENVIREYNYLFTSVLQHDLFYYASWILPSHDILNDTVSIDIQVEPPEETLQGYSQDGTLAWTIGNFRFKRESAAKASVRYQLSPYFYLSPKGYRVRAYAFVNGFDKYSGKGLTMAISFLTGPYDADLSRSFKHKATVTLFHPTDLTKVIVKSVDRDLKDGRWYGMDMGTHAEVENLLDEDTLYYHIRIIPA